MIKGLEDRAAGVLVSIAGCLSLWEAGKLYPYRSGLFGGDHVFPGLAGFGLLVSGLVLSVYPDKRHGESEPPPEKGVGRKVAILPAVLFGYTVLLPMIGYQIGTFAAAVLLFRVLGVYRWRSCLLWSVILTVAFQLVFVEWLHTPLPAGKLMKL